MRILKWLKGLFWRKTEWFEVKRPRNRKWATIRLAPEWVDKPIYGWDLLNSLSDGDRAAREGWPAVLVGVV